MLNPRFHANIYVYRPFIYLCIYLSIYLRIYLFDHLQIFTVTFAHKTQY